MLRWTVTKKKEDGQERNSHAFVAVGHKLYSFGGKHNYSDQVDVHVFNTVSLSWATLPPVTIGTVEHLPEVSSTHWGHTAVLMENTIYIWGGVPYGNVLYAFDVNVHMWFKPKVSGTVPVARCCHSACVLGKVMYVFGGFSWLTKYSTNDVYTLDTTTPMVWSLINTRGTLAAPSECHSATIIGTKMFVMGGQESHFKSHHNVRVFDTETGCWISTPSTRLPSEGYMCHSAFAYNGELYLFGHTEIDDFWKFNPETFSWRRVEPKGKGPCRMFRMCCCMVEDRIILFKDDLYILDFSPSLKTLCKMSVIQYGLEKTELPHDIRWELAAMTTNSNR